jgi:hypothetical protein
MHASHDSDIVPDLGLLGSLALQAQMQKQRHDTEGDSSTSQTDGQ